MTEYLPLKKSQIPLFREVPFYYKTQSNEYALYKKKGECFGEDRLVVVKYPDLYIRETDRDQAIAELSAALNKNFKKNVAEGKLRQVREALAQIVEEALTPGQEASFNSLPETLEILMDRYSGDHMAMNLLAKLGTNSSVLVEHTVNVTALVLQYCFFYDLPEADTQQMAMAALLHDVGCSQFDKKLVETSKRLTDNQFETYKTHPNLGHDITQNHANFDIAIPTAIQEHHERLDGSGYPEGKNRISSYSQLIGLIDCYEALTYHSKSFRKKKRPYDTLSIIKQEVVDKKFSKDIYKRFTSCLVR